MSFLVQQKKIKNNNKRTHDNGVREKEETSSRVGSSCHPRNDTVSCASCMGVGCGKRAHCSLVVVVTAKHPSASHRARVRAHNSGQNRAALSFTNRSPIWLMESLISFRAVTYDKSQENDADLRDLNSKMLLLDLKLPWAII